MVYDQSTIPYFPILCTIVFILYINFGFDTVVSEGDHLENQWITNSLGMLAPSVWEFYGK